MKIVFKIICFFFVFLSYSQTEVDSLKRILKSNSIDSVKVEALLKLNHIYRRSNLDSAIIFVQQAIQLSKTSEHKILLARSKHVKGVLYAAKNEYQDAERLYDEALELFNDLNDSQNHILRLKLNKASLYRKQFKNEVAIEMYFEALELANHLKDKNSEARIYSNIGVLYKTQKQYNTAIEFLNKALVLVRALNFKPGISACLINLASVFYDTKKYDKGITYLEEAIPLKKQLNDKLGTCRAIGNLATIYVDKEEYNLAKSYYLEALELAQEVNSPEQLLIINFGLARVDFYQENYQECLTISKSLIKSSDSTRQYQILEKTYKLMSDAYAKLGQHEKAYRHAILYKQIADSIYNKNIIEVTNSLNAKYTSEKKEKDIVQLTAKNNEIILQKKNQRVLLLSGLILLSMVSLLFFFLYRNRRKLHNKLIELDKTKFNFFTNISHEFRTPLTLIEGPLYEQLKDIHISAEQRNSLEMMQRNTDRLLKLVDQLLDISKIELGSFQLNLTKSHVIGLIANLIESFEFAAKQKMIILNSDLDNVNTCVYVDEDVIEKITINILSNAVKYTPKNGQIVCNANVSDGCFLLEIKNSGSMLSSHDLENLFEPFYRVNNEGYGSGVGLALVKELVYNHLGKLSLTSNKEWTTFIVSIPVKSVITPEVDSNKVEMNSNLKNDLMFSNLLDSNIDTNKNLPLILIVDDNSDVRSYITQIFKKSFQFIYAGDGQEGISQAINHIPDLIISDVMMPIKDGFLLCKTLKNDERSSHIPIILLTAKIGDESTIEGIESGADDYIIKPFNSNLLRSKVSSLLENRKRLQLLYSKELTLKPKGIVFNTVEKEFLKRVQVVLDENLTEPSFSIEEFCLAIGMSRMKLHRKMKAIIGVSTSEFIRTQRLKLAAELLRTSAITISEVGYSVGFNNHAYFSKCFKDQFGCTPTQYSNEQN